MKTFNLIKTVTNRRGLLIVWARVFATSGLASWNPPLIWKAPHDKEAGK